MPTGAPRPDQLWAKLDRDPRDKQISRWHSLLDHSADVAACAQALLERTLLGARLAHSAGLDALAPAHIARICALIALHDAGKANHGFQDRAHKTQAREGHISPIIHALESSSSLADKLLRESLQLEPMASWFFEDDERPGSGGLLSALLTVWAHHGRPVRAQPLFSEALWSPQTQRDPLQGLSELRRHIVMWFPEAFNDNATKLPCTPSFQHTLNGLVSLADWLGSDMAFFPFSTPDDAPRFPWALEQAYRLMQNIGLDTHRARTSLGPSSPSFAALSTHPNPRPAQAQTAQLPLDPQGSLVILEAETGSGKTEAAFWRFLQLLHAGLVDGLYFALPTRAAATQIFDRVRVMTQLAFPDPDARPPVTLAVPGYLRVDDRTGLHLPRFEVRWDEDDQTQLAWHQRAWSVETPTRFLAGAIVVGTLDQALLSTLQIRYAHLRASALMRHLLVIDEIHASDVYMGQLVTQLLKTHLDARGHAMLMSATLGAMRRERLLGQEPPSLHEASRYPYPLLSWTQPGLATPGRLATPVDSPARTIHLSQHPWMQEHETLAAKLLTQAREGARVLVIRSTVSACVALQRAVEALALEHPQDHALLMQPLPGRPSPHHARYSPRDRQLLDRAVQDALAPKGPQRGVIVIATQTVEQSLDLDADVLWTDLCPMDVLLQRVGRLHRHRWRDPQRPPGYDQARLHVLTPSTRDLSTLIRSQGLAHGPCGLGTVYEDLLILEATWRQLEAHDTLIIPTMSRALVELTTHPEALDAIARAPELDPEAGSRWIAHLHALYGQRFARRQIASVHTLDRDHPYETCFTPESDEQRATTRLGGHDRVILFPTPPLGPFDQPLERLTLPAHLARGLGTDTPTPQLIPCDLPHTLRLRLEALNLIYDRFGLRADLPQ